MNTGPRTPLELLSKMIAFNTVNEHISNVPFPEREMLQYLEDLAIEWGFQAQRLPINQYFQGPSYNLLISFNVSPNVPTLLFESHADTVSIEGMTIPPLEAHLIEGKIFGRGVCDTKGSGASMLFALRNYAQQSHQPNNIVLLFVTDEEISKVGTSAFVQKQLSDLGWRPSGVIVGEPTLCKLVVAHNGVIRWSLKTKGVAAHSSQPSNGKSAITSMAKLVLEFEKEYCHKITATHPLTGAAACSINTISGGTGVNIIPSECVIEIDRRTVPGEDSEIVRTEIEVALNSIARADPSIIFEISPPFIDLPLDPTTNQDFADQVSDLLAKIGMPGQQSGVGYGTDASTYSAIGLPTIVLGPGSIDQAHTKDEWLDISELEKAVFIYSHIMQCGL